MGSGGPQKLVTVVWSGLAGEVRHIRDDCGLSLEVVCEQLGWQQSDRTGPIDLAPATKLLGFAARHVVPLPMNPLR